MDGAARATVKTGSFEERVPFRLGTEEALELDATVRGRVPAWLAGQLVRTCPAVFRAEHWRAQHWFDGLGMLYAFRVGPSGVRYAQRLLEGATVRAARGDGRYQPAGFATPQVRSLWRRLFEPVPEITDNTNVHIVPAGEELLAMTESPHQLRVDPRTLEPRGVARWEDRLGELVTSAHPHFDVARREVLNVASELGASPALALLSHAYGGHARRLVARWPARRLPYVHSFGLSARKAALIAHPLTVNPLALLWSNKGFIEHFRWDAAEGTKLVVLDREGGPAREHRTDALFVFHTIHAFDDGEDLVLDVVAYDDARVVSALGRGALDRALPEVAPRPLRLRLRPGVERAVREPLGDLGFEFPSVHYAHVSGRAHRLVWGAALHPEGLRWRSTLVRLDTHTGATRTFAEPGWVFGEPVFAAEPGATEEGQGVLLCVGSHQDGARSAMLVLDAAAMEPLAWAEVATEVPLGFHGSFVRQR